jgi:hypothetical protein
MNVNIFVIKPTGTLSERLLVMVSAVVFCSHMKLKVQMIWDHEIPYHILFLNNIEIVSIESFNGLDYIYNPNIDQHLLYDKIISNQHCKMNMIIETNKEFKACTMTEREYVLDRQNYYLHILKENLNGMVLGQLNLFDFPPEPFCCIFGNFETKMNQFVIDDSLFDIRNKELIEYVKSLAYSKATLIVSTENELNSEVVNASKISSTTIVMTESVPDLLPDYLLKNVSYNFLDFKSVINPDIKKISLL